MTFKTSSFTFDDVQSAAETFAQEYRQSHQVPALPSEDELLKYKKLLNEEYSSVVDLAKKHTDQFDPEGGHGFDHLTWVSALAGWIAEKECQTRGFDETRTSLIVRKAVLAGLLHDIDRHLGYGEDHMIQGAETAKKILESAGVDFPEVIEVVANHDKLTFAAAGNEDVEIIFGSVFDADHFRYGLEREDTFWRMKEKKGSSAPEVIHDYEYLPKYLHAWRTSYGKEVGPQFIEFGLAIAKHVEETFA